MTPRRQQGAMQPRSYPTLINAAGVAAAGRAGRPGGPMSGTVLGRTAAARRHYPRHRDESATDAVRRGDVALDPELVNEVLQVIRDLAQDGMSMRLVTHEMRFAHEVSDMVIFMEDAGSAKWATRARSFAPPTERLAEFLKTSTFN